VELLFDRSMEVGGGGDRRILQDAASMLCDGEGRETDVNRGSQELSPLMIPLTGAKHGYRHAMPPYSLAGTT
jgi:hypothetical protein